MGKILRNSNKTGQFYCNVIASGASGATWQFQFMGLFRRPGDSRQRMIRMNALPLVPINIGDRRILRPGQRG